MRKTLIAGNWKLNCGAADAEALARGIARGHDVPIGREAVLCPPFTSLAAVAAVVRGTSFRLGAQDCFWEVRGAYTGEVSPAMLKEAGCRYVIVGHSERRRIFLESDAQVNRKARAALAAGLRPIVCVGETLEQRERGETSGVVEAQLRGSLAEIPAASMGDVVLAYEPVWAIGTGRNATPDQVNEVHSFVRKLLAAMFGSAAAEDVRIQYGGSVTAENARSLLSLADVDGALVGGASLTAESFLKIVGA
jgi:triosephosphate isomerase